MLDPIQGTLEELQVSDLVFSQLRDYDKYDIDTNIVVINNGHLERNELAEMINIINYYEPKVIAIDAMFRKDKGPEIDEPLVEAFSNTENLVLAVELFQGGEDSETWDTVKTSNIKFTPFSDSAYVNMTMSPDHFRTVRNITVSQIVDSLEVPSFSLKTAEIFAPKKPKDIKIVETKLR
jgi:CHASE2 domain-containing sensor protein